MPLSLTTGRILWAEIPDANGVRKLRPADIVTPAERLTATGPFEVVAVTSRVPHALPENHVLLPWHAQGHPRTGLKRRSAAVCSWVARLTAADVRDVAGIVPSRLMAVILTKVAAALPPAPVPPTDTGGSPPDGPSAMPPDASKP